MTENPSALVQRFFDEVFNARSDRAAAELIAADFIAHHPSFPDGIRGPQGIMQNVAFFRGGFPDLRYRVDALIAEGDMVAARWSATGTHKGDFLSIPPTGRPVSITGMDMFRVEDGRLVEAWVNSDFFGLMQQLGAIPAGG